MDDKDMNIEKNKHPFNDIADMFIAIGKCVKTALAGLLLTIICLCVTTAFVWFLVFLIDKVSINADYTIVEENFKWLFKLFPQLIEDTQAVSKNILRIVLLTSIIIGLVNFCIFDKVKNEAINGITKESRKVIDGIATIVTAIPYIAFTLYRYEIAKTSNIICYILGTVVIFNMFIRLLKFSSIFCSNKAIAIILILIIEYIVNIFIFLYTPAIAALIVLYALFLIAGQSSSSSHRENGGLDFLDGVFLGYFLR